VERGREREGGEDGVGRADGEKEGGWREGRGMELWDKKGKGEVICILLS